MTPNNPAAASKASPVRGSLSGAGRGVVPEQPFPADPGKYFTRVGSPEWQAYLDKIDAQVRREQVEPSLFERAMVPFLIVLGVVSSYLVVTM